VRLQGDVGGGGGRTIRRAQPPMPTLTIRPPADYFLARDVCSYGYFLLAPNFWDVRRGVFATVLAPSGRALGVIVSQPQGPGSPLKVSLSRAVTTAQRSTITTLLTRMLRLDEPAGVIAEFHSLDPRFAAAGRGRLMRSSTLFEDVIKTVTSCNVTWPSTVAMNTRLCEVLGAGLTHGKIKRFAFPTAAKVAKTSPATLRARCRVGYRDVRIVQLAKLFCTSARHGGIDSQLLEDPATPDETVFAYLLELPGIGPYAAANIMQLLGRYSRLPLDTESVRHGRAVMGLKGSAVAIMKRVYKHFKPMGQHAFRSYWFELWEHYEKKHGPSHTWERDTTGRMFTAALLNKSE